MNNNFKYEFYNGKSINNFFLDEMYHILVNNYNEINNIDNSSKEIHDEWISMIRNTNNYNILLCLENNKVIAFIAYTNIEDKLMLSEIQIKKEYQSKYNILKSMIKYVINKENNYKKILITINSNNTKSKDIFTHIGFKNIKGILYEIDIINLMKWTK